MRVSTHGQKDDTQHDELTAAGCERIFTDRGVSGKLASRPGWDECLAYLRPGDVLVITRLSRAMRSMRDLLNVAHDLADRGIGLRVLKQAIDTTTPAGRLTFHILAAVDEFTRELIVEGTREGVEAARARGRKGGRRPSLDPRRVRTARQLYDGGETVAEIAKILQTSRATIYRYLERDQEPTQ
jgi:DNA invertase Pin-like site-specific DNA recombinase